MGPEFIEINDTAHGIYTYINVNYIGYVQYSREENMTKIRLASGNPDDFWCYGDVTDEIMKQIKQIKKGGVT